MARSRSSRSSAPRIDGPHPAATGSSVANSSVVNSAAANSTSTNSASANFSGASSAPAAAAFGSDREAASLLEGAEPAWGESLTIDPREELREQAEQLAEFLQDRQRALDAREAKLNSLAAQLEQQERSARLWLRERSHDFEKREETLREREASFAEQAARLTAAELAAAGESRETERQRNLQEEELRNRLADLETKQERIRRAEQGLLAATEQLFQQRSELELQIALERQQGAAIRQNDLETHRLVLAGLERRRGAIDDDLRRRQEAASARERELQQREEHLLAREAAVRTAEGASARRAKDLEREQERSLAALAEKEEALDARSNRLAERHAKVMRGEDELAAVQRETLEMQLAIEESWSELAGRYAPSQLASSIARTRLRIADQYRLAEESLATQRAELQQGADRLELRVATLRQQRETLYAWVRQRQVELEAREANLRSTGD